VCKCNIELKGAETPKKVAFTTVNTSKVSAFMYIPNSKKVSLKLIIQSYELGKMLLFLDKRGKAKKMPHN